MARRPTAASGATEDEPWGWESRDFLRQLLVGKQVLASVNYKVNSGMRLLRLTSRVRFSILVNYY
jgi:hypothetical protein